MMFDFPILPEVAPKWAWLLSGIIYLLIILVYYRWAFSRPVNSNFSQNKHFLTILIFIYCVTAIYCGDWVHLQTIVKESVGTDYIEGNSVERIYHYLANELNGNYLLFRIVVWGLGLFFLIKSFEQAKVDPYRSLFFLFGVYITLFAYSRAGVAHAAFYWGFLMLFQNKESRTFFSIIIALGIIAFSVILHRSMIVLAVLLPLSLIPFRKNPTFFILLTVLGFIVLWRTLFENAISFMMNSEEYAYRIELYESLAGKHTFSFDINGLFYMWYKSIIHVPFLYCAITLIKINKQSTIPNSIHTLLRFAIILYLFVIMMLILYGSASAFYYRYEAMLYIPITIMTVYLYQSGYMKRNVYVLMFCLCALSQFKDFLYRIIFV